jgi:hypothetical protein
MSKDLDTGYEKCLVYIDARTSIDIIYVVSESLDLGLDFNET